MNRLAYRKGIVDMWDENYAKKQIIQDYIRCHVYELRAHHTYILNYDRIKIIIIIIIIISWIENE